MSSLHLIGLLADAPEPVGDAAQTSANTARTRAAQADSLANYNQQTNAGGAAGATGP